MYITCFAGSPCVKTVSFPLNLATFLPRPAESRNNFTSKTGIPEFAFLKEGVTFASTALGGICGYYGIDFSTCSLLNSRVCRHSTPTSAKSHENTKDCSFLRETLRDEWPTSNFHVPR